LPTIAAIGAAAAMTRNTTRLVLSIRRLSAEIALVSPAVLSALACGTPSPLLPAPALPRGWPDAPQKHPKFGYCLNIEV
jgi:hypothetical protein